MIDLDGFVTMVSEVGLLRTYIGDLTCNILQCIIRGQLSDDIGKFHIGDV